MPLRKTLRPVLTQNRRYPLDLVAHLRHSLWRSFVPPLWRHEPAKLLAAWGCELAISVSEVAFVKESGKKLTGFVRLKMESLGGVELTKNCEATMGQDAQYIWRCE